MRIIEKTKDKQPDTIICERCISGDPALYVVSSDVIHMRVCAACAEAARKLGLTVTTRVAARPTVKSIARGLGSQMKLGKLLGATTACLAVCVIYSRMFRNCDMKPNFLGRIELSMRLGLSPRKKIVEM